MARDYFDESKNKKKVTKKKTEDKKPQSSSVTKPKTTKTKVDKVASKSTFLGGGASTQKVEQAVSKPKTVKKPSSQKKQNITQQERINQKSYGTTKPNVTTKTQRTKRDTTPVTSSQRQKNAEANMNLKQRNIRDTAPVQSRRTVTTTAAQRQMMGMPTQQDLKDAKAHRRELANNIKASVREASSETNKGFMQRQKSGTLTTSDKKRIEQTNQRRAEVAKNTRDVAKKAVLDTGSGYAQSLYDLTELTASNKNGTKAKAMKMGLDPNRDRRQIAELEREQKYTAAESKRRRDELFQKQEQRQAEWDERTKNAKGLEKAWYGAVESGTGMVADTLVGAATGTGQFGALASMGLRTYGSSANQARKEGATDKEARLYGLAQSAKEVGTELMFQGAGLAKAAYGRTGLSLADKSANILTKGLTGLKADAVGAGVRALGGTAEENIEELAGWMADPLIKELTYGKAVRNRMKENLRANIPQIGSDADAANVASYFSTPKFTDDLTNEYVKSGMSKDKASALAAEMRDYYVAYYSGDKGRLDALEEDLAAKLSGQDKLSLRSWSMDELKDTFASTTLLTLATGVPGAVTTSVKGNQIFDSDEVKAVFGNDAVRKVADAVKNTSNREMSLKAETMEDRLNSGKDLTGTQKYDLYQGYIEKVNETSKKARASNGVVENARREQNLVPTMGVDRAGNTVYAKETQREYDEKYASTAVTAESLRRFMESDNSISDDEIRRTDAAIKAVSDLHVGGLTIGDAHEFAYGNNLARETLKIEEGIDLDKYIVRKADGTVDLAATNEATENALFRINADNAIKAAQAETEVFIDDTRGNIDKDLLTRFGNNGQAVWKEVNKDLDPRDIQNYLTTANAASYFYSAGRNTDMSVDSAINNYADTFKTVDNAVLKRAFAAGARDRIIANTPGYGQTVEAGSNIQMKKTEPVITGQLIMDDDVVLADSDQSAYLALAMSTNTNIHIVSNLNAMGKDGKPIINQATGLPVQLNGMSHGNDIYLNMNEASEKNLGYVFMHEMTHQIKQYAPNEYLALENLVRDKWFNKDATGMQAAIKQRMDLYSVKGGQQLTEEEAVEEIIADAMAEAMDDPNFAAEVCEQDINLGEKILESIRGALRSIRQIFANSDYKNDRFHNSLLSYLGILDDAEKMWLNALATARQNKADGLIADWQDKANKQNAPRLSVTEVSDEGHEGRYSITPQQDADYMKAVESNDMDTAQRMVDEAAAAAMPHTKLKGRWYHGTENEFTVFNFSQGGKNGTADGYGIYLTNDPKVAESYGQRMIEGYVNVERPASGLTSQTLTDIELHRLISRTVDVEAETLMYDEGYDNVGDAKKDTWISNYTNTYEASSLDQAIDDVIKTITQFNGNDFDIIQEIMNGMGIRDYEQATAFYDILTEETGIDGLETKWGDESEMADPNAPTIALAFKSEQIKDASPVTYDDDGKPIPLSERFNTENEDIRYSLTPEQQRDADYMDAVNSNDMDEAQRLVNEAAKMAGFDTPLYHGTEAFGFTTIDNEAPGADGFSFWAASREDASATYTLYGKRRNISDGALSEDEQESMLDEVSSEIDNAIDEFRDLIDRTFSEWVFGQSDNSYLRSLVDEANPQPGNGDGVYDVLSEIVFDAYHDYGMDSEMEYDEWSEESEEGQALWDAVNNIEALRGKLADIENGEIKGGIYGLYANTNNLYELDAESKAWNELRPEGLPELPGYTGVGTRPYKTRDVANWARENGYDGVRFKNIKDNGQYGRTAPFDVYAFFKPQEQVKSADAVTYAEDGSVIPLSERFDPTNNDIRYSLPTQDSDGKILTDGQMEYFKNSQARDEQGRLVPVYHTTNYGGFTVFDPSYSDDKRSLFFASNWNVSQTYGRNADRKYRFEDYSFKSLNDFAKAYAENFSNNLNDPENDILEQVVNALRIHIEKNSMPAFDLGDTMFERVKNYMKIAEAGDARAGKYRIEMKGAYGGMVRASSYDELLGKLSRQMSNNTSKSGYYECYLNLENPLIVDAQNQSWNNIPYGEYSEDAVLAIKNLTVQDMGDGIYVNIWGDRKIDGAWQEFRDSDTIEFEYLTVDGEYEIPEKAWDEVYDFLVKHGLSSDYAYEHSDAFFDFNGLDTFDKDGRKVESNVRRYRTRELAALADAKGYDSVIIRNCYDIGAASHLKGEGLSDIYIAFSSNQVKDTRNENPTENPDIRYSITPEDEAMSKIAYDDAMDNSYELLAYYEQQLGNVNPETFDVTKAFREEDVVRFLDALKSEDYVPSADASFEEDRVRRAKSKEDFYNNVYAKWNDRWTTEGEVLKISSVKRDITNLVKGAMANSDSDAQYRNEIVRKTLLDARIAYQLMKQDRTELASYLLYHSAQRMIDGLEFIRDDTAFKEYKEIRDFLRTYRINAPEEYWHNVEFNDFRKEYYGRLRIGKGNNNIESVYRDCEDRWPHLFNESEREKAGLGDSVEDLLQHIGVVVDSNVTPFMEAYSSEEAASLAYDLADQLYEIIANGDREVSLADSYKERYDAKTEALKARHAEAILRERKIREEGVKKERQKFRAYKEREKEKQAHKKYFDRITETHDKLVERLASNTADKHIPEQYKKELAKLLAAFDLQTVGSKAREARTGHVAKNTIRMNAIKEALKSIEERTELFHVNDAITDLMDELSSVEGKTIDSLSSAELWNIDRLLKSLLHEFNRYEKVKIGVKSMQAADLASAQTASAIEHAKTFGPGNDYFGIKGWMDQIINMDEMTPAYMFKRIDPENVGLGLMWKEIKRSQDRYIRNTAQIQKWVEEIIGDYHNKGRFNKKYGSETIEKWRSSNYQQTYNLTNGTVQLTPAQAMSLYCLSKRNQAYGHMVGAGVVVAPVSFQAKLMSDLKRKTNRALPVILTDADIKTVVQSLTPEQIQVANQLQELMSTKMADLGNEASMNVLGIKLFNEQDYFPIKSDKAALERDLSNEEFENAIRNFGFTKAVQPGARNAIMIEDIFDVLTEHCNNMNLYNSYSETLNDFMKVFNKHTIMEDGSDYSVRQAVAHAYSQKATTFIMEFIRDLNGNVSKGRATGLDNAMSDMLGRAKQASVFANIRVLLQQPTAITRAFAVIDPKYLKGVSLADVAKGSIPTVTTEAMQEMFDHCPIALWKSWGYYDINMGRSIESVIMNEGNFLEDLATSAYGKADNITWTAIWQMVKEETKDKHPELKEGTDEFWDHCNERMSEIVDFTQVVDSPLHRSHLMRSKQLHHKIFSAFMAEPTLTFNMIRDGYASAKEEWMKGNKSKAAKTMGRIAAVASLQAATVAAAAAIADAIRGKNKGGGDDDDDSFGALWYKNFLENLKDEAKIWNKVYYIKDLASIAEGWDNANLALQGWKTLTDGFRQFDKKMFEGSKTPWWNIYYNLLGGIGYFTGVPVKTLMKDGRAIFELLGGQLPESLVGEEKSESVISSDSKLQSLRLLKGQKDNDKKTITSAVRVNMEDKWYDYENNPITVKDGSALDKILNHFGINLTASEKAQIAASQAQQERDSKAEEISNKYADLSGEERDKKVWSSVTTYYKNQGEDSKVFADMVANGDYGDINEMKSFYLKAGGNAEYFDKRVLAESKKALKKSIKYGQTNQEIDAQERVKNYMLSHGMTEQEVSEIVYKSDTAKDMKVAFRLNDKDLMMETLEPLVNAGLTYEDLERLWENRNRMQLSSYNGRYKDKLKSTGKFIWPTDGVITSHFGYRNAPTAGASSNHPAIDIGAPQGTAVVAADGGVVISAGANGGYGNSVGIKHDNGMITWYNHLYDWNVKVGDTVAQGQQIAQVGSTGISTGPHLDFKIMDTDGNPVDPEKYLDAR